jgi:hypothetical protein
MSFGKFKLIASIAAAVLIITVSMVVFSGFIGAPAPQINEFQNDVQVNIGSSYPDIVDMVNALIAKNENLLNVAITVKDPIVALGDKESAQFDMILILENQEDALQTYELRVDMNASGCFGVVEDVQTKSQQPIQLIVDGNTLKITATLSELSSATKAEWNICSTYEKTSGNQVIDSAWDFVPDQGLTTTIF